jgi:hypothetical protein
MKQVVWLAAILVLSACATPSVDVGPSYVSPLQYQNYSCDQLIAEAQRISNRAAEAAGAQDQRRKRDALATTVGIVIFWPSLFFIRGDNEKTAELARLKGEMDAIEQTSIQKNCGIVFEKKAPAQPEQPPRRAGNYNR